MGRKMKEPTVATIRAKYRYVSGYHVFTSDDVKGLYVASKDAKTAFDNVCPVLKDLIELKLKDAVDVEPTMTFKEFMAYVEAQRTMAASPVLRDREFMVRRAA